jgi:integrase
MINKLSARYAETTTKSGRHSDGGGLYLFISPGGRRRWIFRYTRGGRTVEMGLGAAGKGRVPLAAARELATEARRMLAGGRNPLEAKRAAARSFTITPSFGDVADQFVEMMRPSWRNLKHAWQWQATLTSFAAPIRNLGVDKIDTEQVVSVLKPLWHSRLETARRLRGRIERVLDHAKARGLRSGENPARWRGHLDQLLPKRQRLSDRHYPALSYDRVPDFLAELRTRDAIAARLLEFTILTAARSGEARGARWHEFDYQRALWVVPAGRMKAGRDHRVPLSARAMQIVTEMQAIQRGELVFPGNHDRPLSDMAMLKLLQRMGYREITVHGFRSAFRDWSAETTGFPHEVCEMALAHTIGNRVEAAYRRGDLFEKRRALMEAWAEFAGSSSERLDPRSR